MASDLILCVWEMADLKARYDVDSELSLCWFYLSDSHDRTELTQTGITVYGVYRPWNFLKDSIYIMWSCRSYIWIASLPRAMEMAQCLKLGAIIVSQKLPSPTYVYLIWQHPVTSLLCIIGTPILRCVWGGRSISARANRYVLYGHSISTLAHTESSIRYDSETLDTPKRLNCPPKWTCDSYTFTPSSQTSI